MDTTKGEHTLERHTHVPRGNGVCHVHEPVFVMEFREVRQSHEGACTETSPPLSPRLEFEQRLCLMKRLHQLVLTSKHVHLTPIEIPQKFEFETLVREHRGQRFTFLQKHTVVHDDRFVKGAVGIEVMIR